MSLADVQDRDTLVALGLLRCDDRGDLRVYSYTERCRRERAWNDVTLNSRGIIFNRRTGECVARPFPKFFTVGEPGFEEECLPWGEIERINEKVDGYLGILYRADGRHWITTRGRFTTDAAGWASAKLMAHNLDALPDDVTLCFEIVHPITRVVVDYGGREALVLLAAFNRHTGAEYPWRQVEAWGQAMGFPVAERYPADLDALAIRLAREPGERWEGAVIRFRDGSRVKVKGAGYLEAFSPLAHLPYV